MALEASRGHKISASVSQDKVVVTWSPNVIRASCSLGGGSSQEAQGGLAHPGCLPSAALILDANYPKCFDRYIQMSFSQDCEKRPVVSSTFFSASSSELLGRSSPSRVTSLPCFSGFMTFPEKVNK